MEIGKGRKKKSSPDMFSFYVLLDGHDMVADAGRVFTCRRAGENSKPHDYKQKGQNLKGHTKKTFTEKTLEDFRNKYTSSLHQTNPWNTQPLYSEQLTMVTIKST